MSIEFESQRCRREFIATVMNPREFFDVVRAVNAVLAGDLGQSFALRWR